MSYGGLLGFGILRFPQRCLAAETGPAVEMRPARSSGKLQIDRKLFNRLGQEMGVDVSKVDVMVTRELPGNVYGMFWMGKDGRGKILLAEDRASSNTLAHELFHYAQVTSWSFYRPFRLGWEAYAARAGDAYEWKYRDLVTRS